MITLALDASTYTASVAVIVDDRVVVERSVAMRDREREQLMPAAAESVAEAGLSLRQIDRLVCGEGPGSFTSLRIAASIAKGLAVGLDRPLHAVSSLALVVAAHAPIGDERRYLAALDALRGELYVAEFAAGRTVRQLTPVRLMAREGIEAAVDGAGVVGPGFGPDWVPHARGVVRVEPMDGHVNLADWEPMYGRPAEAMARREASRSVGGPG